MTDKLDNIRLALLRGRTWRYLRYLHFRDYFLRIADQIQTVCVLGAGHGLAETAIALEFPHIRFTLTDIIGKGYPNYHRAMDYCWKFGINNMDFSIWNVLVPTERRFDLVCSTEMLEHIEDAERAAENMRAAARFVYCLVPFADDATNADPVKRARAWARHEHYVFGYDDKAICKLFPGCIAVSGTYWEWAGRGFRAKLQDMPDEQIVQSYRGLIAEANDDLVDRIPQSLNEASGIKILSQVN